MKGPLKASVDIVLDKPIAEVFAFVTDIKNMERWVSGVTEPRHTSETAFGTGSTFTSKYAYGGKTYDITYVVTQYEPPVRYGTESTSEPFPFQSLIELESTGDSTKLTNTISAVLDSKAKTVVYTLLGPLMRGMMKKQLRAELVTLKTALEAQ
jgi:uncharacterized protein YndB with AHSA1/START domain